MSACSADKPEGGPALSSLFSNAVILRAFRDTLA